MNRINFKKVQSLKSTRQHFNEKKNFSAIEIKEFSFLYLVINNLILVKNNFSLIENVILFTDENKIIFQSKLDHLSKE